MTADNKDDSYARRNAFLAKGLVVVVGGGSGLLLIGGGLSQLDKGVGNAVLGLLGAALGLGLVVSAWRAMGG